MKWTVSIILFVVLLVSCTDAPSRSDVQSVAVGTRIVDLTDSGRTDIQGKPYRFSVRVWYPAGDITGCTREIAIEPELADALVNYYGMPGFLFDPNATTDAWNNAPAAKTETPCPVVIFNHGGFSYDKQNERLMLRLAEAGFIVAAISHPGLSLVTRY